MTVLVLAEPQQFKDFIYDNQLSPRKYKLVRTFEHIRGYNDTIMLDLGTKHGNGEWAQIVALCNLANIDIIRVRGYN